MKSNNAMIHLLLSATFVALTIVSQAAYAGGSSAPTEPGPTKISCENAKIDIHFNAVATYTEKSDAEAGMFLSLYVNSSSEFIGSNVNWYKATGSLKVDNSLNIKSARMLLSDWVKPNKLSDDGVHFLQRYGIDSNKISLVRVLISTDTVRIHDHNNYNLGDAMHMIEAKMSDGSSQKIVSSHFSSMFYNCD